MRRERGDCRHFGRADRRARMGEGSAARRSARARLVRRSNSVSSAAFCGLFATAHTAIEFTHGIGDEILSDLTRQGAAKR